MNNEIIGKRFGRLIVLSRSDRKNYYVCECDCGNLKEIRKDSLVDGKTKSCGCYNKEVASRPKTVDVLRNDPLYITWHDMKDRCYNKNSKAYKNYGNRGITLCDDWRNDFKSFRSWALENGWKKGLTIDRINNDESYNPLNCRIATYEQQNNNKRKNVWCEFNGEKHTVAEWSRIIGLPYGYLSKQIHHGKTIEDVLIKMCE